MTCEKCNKPSAGKTSDTKEENGKNEQYCCHGDKKNGAVQHFEVQGHLYTIEGLYINE